MSTRTLPLWAAAAAVGILPFHLAHGEFSKISR